MKKKVLMVMDTMCVGGIERAAISLLSAMPPDRYDMTLVLTAKEGEWLNAVPAWVNVRAVGMTEDGRFEFTHGRRAAVLRQLKRGHLAGAVAVVARYIRKRLTTPPAHWVIEDFRAALGKGTPLSEEYDCVLSFHDAAFLVWYCLRRVTARRRIGWFHADLAKTCQERTNLQDLYNEFDVLVACSSALAERLNTLMPNLRGKITVSPNIVDVSAGRALSQRGPAFGDDFPGMRILSVGRLEMVKGFDVAVRVCARLLRQGYAVRWYVIGEGPARAGLESLVRDLGVGEEFVLLGQHSNPFPFFAACDLYVQPSRSEGFCLTVAEARMFNKPIVCTDFPAAHDQIVDGETGRIVACDEDAIFCAVQQLLDEPARCEAFSANLACTVVDNRGDVEPLCRMIDG